MCVSFNGNSYTTIVSSNNPTNASDEADIITFYELFSLIWHIPKQNVLIITANMNAQIGKDENNKFLLHNLLNRNWEYLADFLLKNRLACLNTKFPKREWGTMALHQKKGGKTIDLHLPS